MSKMLEISIEDSTNNSIVRFNQTSNMEGECGWDEHARAAYGTVWAWHEERELLMNAGCTGPSNV